MIRGLHGLFYSSDADATRAFLRDQLKLPHTDVGQGWLVFDLPESDLGVHPIGDEGETNKHDVSFYCDDIQGTVAALRARGVQFSQEVADHGYGFVTYMIMPGGVIAQLYEPKYQKAAKPAAKSAPKARAAKARSPKRATKVTKKAAAAKKKTKSARTKKRR